MGRIIKLGKIEAYIDYPEDVVNTYFDLTKEKIEKNYGKGWRLPTLEELMYIRSLKIDLGIIQNLNSDDDYWTCTPGEPDYIPDRNEYGSDLRFFYQVRLERNYVNPFLCHVDYYGNILPVRDI